jgi:hypothetical protein
VREQQTTLRERFEDKFTPEPNSGCWLWTGATVEKGYGVIYVSQTSPKQKQVFRRAHRVAWELYRGEIPSDLIVCHRCDVPACVNPGHLFLGTHKDNLQDCARKGRLRTQRGKGSTMDG